jgi:hypothetical protein
MNRTFRASSFLVLGCLLPLAASPQTTSRVLVCGSALLAAASEVPAGLPSASCSEALSFGEGTFVTNGGQSSPAVEPVALVKPLDANAVRFRERLLAGNPIGTVYFHAFTSGAGGLQLQYLQLQVDNAEVSAITSGTAGVKPVETVRVSGSRYTWRVWSPPAPPGSAPTASFCWDLAVQGAC